MALTGCNFVRFTRHGLQSMRHHWGRMGDRFEVRRQALKLRFWDERHEHPPGMLLDHSYESIKALPGLSIYELRVDDEIGGQSNIRVVFFDPPKDWHPSLAEARPMRTVWGGASEKTHALDEKRVDAVPNVASAVAKEVLRVTRSLRDHWSRPAANGTWSTRDAQLSRSSAT